MDLLVQFGMQINAKKSAILYRCRGSFGKKWRHRNFVQLQDGPALRLRCPSGKLLYIPLREEHVYLGAVISFHKISAPTMKHRSQVAAAAWNRLKPVLGKRSLVSLAKRCIYGGLSSPQRTFMD